jgi:hypothetical protein
VKSMLRKLFRRESAKRRLGKAQGEFDETAQELLAANRAAQSKGERITSEMARAAEKNSAALRTLIQAKRELERVEGGPDPVELTEGLHRKVCRLFSAENQAEVIYLLEKECGRGLPFYENATSENLERVRLAVLKLSDGDVSELRNALHVAKSDWRDVLLAAEQPEALRVGLVAYSELPPNRRLEIDQRDREEYESWLRDETANPPVTD